MMAYDKTDPRIIELETENKQLRETIIKMADIASKSANGLYAKHDTKPRHYTKYYVREFRLIAKEAEKLNVSEVKK